MSKVRITEEQARAIEERKRTNLLDLSIIHHVNGKWKGATNYVLNDLTLDEFIRALYIGYEIEPEFKEGDIVNDGYDAIREIAEVEEGGIMLYTNYKKTSREWFGNKGYDYKQIRHATDVEVELYKKCKFWYENGREVGEFKKNDILSVEGANYAYTISKVLVGKSNNKLYKIDEDSARYTKEMLLKDFVVTCFAHDRKDIKND